MHENSVPSSSKAAAANSPFLPPPPPPPPPPPLSRLVVFRLLCHDSRVRGFIGKSGSIIRQLQRDTAAKIYVDVSTPNSDNNRIIVVEASSLVDKKIRLLGPIGDKQRSEEFCAIEVSSAQKALVRVFERLIEVTAEKDGVVLGVEDVVSCRLLLKGHQAGALMGKGGKEIDTIRRENGCRIRVLTSGKLPSRASPKDDIVEIEGDILAVKKGLVAVSGRLQDCFYVGTTPLELDSEQTLQPKLVDLPAESSSMSQLITTSSFSAASGRHTVADRFSSIDSKMASQEFVFRILCTHDKVGAIIGKGGAIVRALQNESGTSIIVGPNITECNEQMITITALKNLESRGSPAQTAVGLIFDRILDAGSRMYLGKRSPITFRLVVTNKEAGCILGKGGAIISDIRKETGTSIRIFRGDQVPKCVSRNDEVVQVRFFNLSSSNFTNTFTNVPYHTSKSY